MDDKSGTVGKMLEEMDLDTTEAEDASPSGDRLSSLHEAGAITDEEYELLRNHLENDSEVADEEDSSQTAETVEFGTSLAVSEGAKLDLTLLGVFDDVDTTKLETPGYADEVSKDELPPQVQGGPSRTLVFWQIHNHSDQEVALMHRDFEWIGDDQIAYNQDNSPVHKDRLEPGWRTDKESLSAGTRVKYASGVEIPVQLDEIIYDGYSSDKHDFTVTDEMRFETSELPAAIDL